MAWLEVPPSGIYHVGFRFNGRKHKKSLDTDNEVEAKAAIATLELNLRLFDRGRLDIPSGTDIPAFLLSDGKVNGTVPTAPSSSNTPPPSLSLATVFQQFFASIPESNLEDNTLACMHIHEKHLLRVLTPDFDVARLTLQDLQRYVSRRAKEHTLFFDNDDSNGKRRKRTNVTAATIKKEIVTLGTAWRWASSVPLVTGPFPRKGLRFPKTKEKPPFQTWDEIERQINQNQLTGRDAALLWDALYLRRTEIDAMLSHVKSAALFPFIYPMFVMATHTGARRSELLRSQPADFDFDAGVVTLHEKKRVRGKLTTRRVDMSPTLRTAMLHWFENDHPGGSHTFCHSTSIRRSRTRTKRSQPVTRDQAHDHLQRTLAGSRWEKIRGWHCFRHSFISNMACNGIDQRIIDEFVGHTTEEMRRRYRHLFPDVTKAAMDKVFG